MSLKGKTLFITGASRGIGLAIALKAARDGANIAVAAKTDTPHPKLPGTIHTAASEIEAAGGKALPMVVDVRDEENVKKALDATAAEIRRHRHRGQQRERDPADQLAANRHAPLRSDAPDQYARHLHGVKARDSASPEGREPAHPDALAAARHEGKMVRGAYRLLDGEVRHEPRGAGACGRAEGQGRGECAVAAHRDRHLGGEQSARRRRVNAHVAHDRHSGGRGLCALQQAEDASRAIS